MYLYLLSYLYVINSFSEIQLQRRQGRQRQNRAQWLQQRVLFQTHVLYERRLHH